MKKTKKLTVPKLKEKVWKEVGRINRIKNPPICYTCGATGLSGSNWHPGHGKANSILPLKAKYDMRNIKSQCLACNVHRNGMTDIFIAKLEKEKEGLAFLKEFCIKVNGYWEVKHTPPMGGLESWQYLTDLLEEYKSVDKLNT